VLVSFAFACYGDYKSYNLRTYPGGKIAELYTSVANLGIKGPVMTADPVFSVYNSNLFIPYYDSSEGMPTELKPSWNMPAKPFQAVVFSPQALYCAKNDLACAQNLSKLHAYIESRYRLVFNGTFFAGSNYYIYLNETFSN
jgi:hypothetical protein